MEHAGKNRVLVNRAILYGSLFRFPDDLLVLFEPSEKQMDLHHRPPAIHISVEIFQIGVILDRFIESLIPETLSKVLRKGGFARPDNSRNPDEHD